MRLGTGEILVVLVVLLLVFGVNKIPQLGDALGKGIRNFRKASTTDGALELVKAAVVEPVRLEAGSAASAPRAAVARRVEEA